MDEPSNVSVNTLNQSNHQEEAIILEEEMDPEYTPQDDHIIEYAEWLGMDLEEDQDLFWIAKEGLMAPLPDVWKPCKTKDTEDIYYFNFTTGESTWDHPCDGYYRKVYEEEKKKKEVAKKDTNDLKKQKAKQDVEQLLGKAEKKSKRRKKPSELANVETLKSKPALNDLRLNSALNSLEKKPLPGISNTLQSIPLNSSDSFKLKTIAPLSEKMENTSHTVNTDSANSVTAGSRASTKLHNALSDSESKGILEQLSDGKSKSFREENNAESKSLLRPSILRKPMDIDNSESKTPEKRLDRVKEVMKYETKSVIEQFLTKPDFKELKEDDQEHSPTSGENSTHSNVKTMHSSNTSRSNRRSSIQNDVFESQQSSKEVISRNIYDDLKKKHDNLMEDLERERTQVENLCMELKEQDSLMKQLKNSESIARRQFSEVESQLRKDIEVLKSKNKTLEEEKQLLVQQKENYMRLEEVVQQMKLDKEMSSSRVMFLEKELETALTAKDGFEKEASIWNRNYQQVVVENNSIQSKISETEEKCNQSLKENQLELLKLRSQINELLDSKQNTAMISNEPARAPVDSNNSVMKEQMLRDELISKHSNELNEMKTRMEEGLQKQLKLKDELTKINSDLIIEFERTIASLRKTNELVQKDLDDKNRQLVIISKELSVEKSECETLRQQHNQTDQELSNAKLSLDKLMKTELQHIEKIRLLSLELESARNSPVTADRSVKDSRDENFEVYKSEIENVKAVNEKLLRDLQSRDNNEMTILEQKSLLSKEVESLKVMNRNFFNEKEQLLQRYEQIARECEELRSRNESSTGRVLEAKPHSIDNPLSSIQPAVFRDTAVQTIPTNEAKESLLRFDSLQFQLDQFRHREAELTNESIRLKSLYNSDSVIWEGQLKKSKLELTEQTEKVAEMERKIFDLEQRCRLSEQRERTMVSEMVQLKNIQEKKSSLNEEHHRPVIIKCDSETQTNPVPTEKQIEFSISNKIDMASMNESVLQKKDAMNIDSIVNPKETAIRHDQEEGLQLPKPIQFVSSNSQSHQPAVPNVASAISADKDLKRLMTALQAENLNLRNRLSQSEKSEKTFAFATEGVYNHPIKQHLNAERSISEVPSTNDAVRMRLESVMNDYRLSEQKLSELKVMNESINEKNTALEDENHLLSKQLQLSNDKERNLKAEIQSLRTKSEEARHQSELYLNRSLELERAFSDYKLSMAKDLDGKDDAIFEYKQRIHHLELKIDELNRDIESQRIERNRDLRTSQSEYLKQGISTNEIPMHNQSMRFKNETFQPILLQKDNEMNSRTGGISDPLPALKSDHEFHYAPLVRSTVDHYQQLHREDQTKSIEGLSTSRHDLGSNGGGGVGGGSIVELSVIVGQQQAIISRMEQQLHLAENQIAEINAFSSGKKQDAELKLPLEPALEPMFEHKKHKELIASQKSYGEEFEVEKNAWLAVKNLGEGKLDEERNKKVLKDEADLSLHELEDDIVSKSIKSETISTLNSEEDFDTNDFETFFQKPHSLQQTLSRWARSYKLTEKSRSYRSLLNLLGDYALIENLTERKRTHIKPSNKSRGKEKEEKDTLSHDVLWNAMSHRYDNEKNFVDRVQDFLHQWKSKIREKQQAVNELKGKWKLQQQNTKLKVKNKNGDHYVSSEKINEKAAYLNGIVRICKILTIFINEREGMVSQLNDNIVKYLQWISNPNKTSQSIYDQIMKPQRSLFKELFQTLNDFLFNSSHFAMDGTDDLVNYEPVRMKKQDPVQSYPTSWKSMPPPAPKLNDYLPASPASPPIGASNSFNKENVLHKINENIGSSSQQTMVFDSNGMVQTIPYVLIPSYATGYLSMPGGGDMGLQSLTSFRSSHGLQMTNSISSLPNYRRSQSPPSSSSNILKQYSTNSQSVISNPQPIQKQLILRQQISRLSARRSESNELYDKQIECFDNLKKDTILTCN